MKSALSIADQGLVSGTNFIISILFARWLQADRYGEWAVLMGAFLFLAGFHNALVIEPMSVLGPANGDFERPAYMSDLLMLHALTTVPLAITMVVAATFSGRFNADIAALGLSFPIILLFWLLRRACYLNARPGRAALGSAIYALTCSLCLLSARNRVSPSVGLVTMAAGSVAGGAFLLDRRSNFFFPRGWRELLAKHWTYGRWATGTSLLYWTTGTFFAPMLGITAGLTSAAIFRSAENFLLPLSQIVTAVSLLVLPWTASESSRRGKPWLKVVTRKASLISFGFATIYAGVVILVAPWLFRTVYANHIYEGSIPVLATLCIAAVFRATSDFGLGLSLRAAARSSPLFWSTFASASVSLTVGIWLIHRYGVVGAAWAAVAASLVQSAVLLWHFASTPELRVTGLEIAAGDASVSGRGY